LNYFKFCFYDIGCVVAFVIFLIVVNSSFILSMLVRRSTT